MSTVVFLALPTGVLMHLLWQLLNTMIVAVNWQFFHNGTKTASDKSAYLHGRQTNKLK